MKIKEWEDKVGKKYTFIKESNISNLRHYFVEKTDNELFCILKKNNLILYLESNDGEHLTGIISNNPNEFNKYNFGFAKSRQNKGVINLKEFIEYFSLEGFHFILSSNATENDLEFYSKTKTLKVSKLTENKIEDEEFYAFYVFNDNEIFSQSNELSCAGEYVNIIVFLGSKNNSEVEYIFVVNLDNRKNDKQYAEFLTDISFYEVNNNSKTKG